MIKLFHGFIPSVFVFTTTFLLHCCIANDYPVQLFKSASTNRNLLISPFVVSCSFAIAFLGSKGQTSHEIGEVFGFDNYNNQFASTMRSTLNTLNDISTKGNVKLFYAAMLWPSDRKRINSTFSEKAHSVLDVTVQPLDFSHTEEACKTVNDWVSKQTRGKFESIISPSDIKAKTRAIITSALYFKGKWESPFSVSESKLRPFYLKRTDSIVVPTMHQESKFGYYENEKVKVLELGYADARISMIVFLPAERSGLPGLENSLTMDSILNWSGQLREMNVDVFLPRYKFSYNIDMKQNLSMLGIKAVFDSVMADLSGISDSLFIDRAIQKSKIEVNEEGTEASSVGMEAILAGIMGLGKPAPVPVFKANHPFLFIIKENSTKTILFIGKVFNPLKD